MHYYECPILHQRQTKDTIIKLVDLSNYTCMNKMKAKINGENVWDMADTNS